MPPRLREDTARELLSIIGHLRADASFRRILLECQSRSVLSWHRTLRRYLDLLLLAGMIRVEEKNVGSVLPQQLYTVLRSVPKLWTGPSVLKIQGLNWDVPDGEIYQVTTDTSALVRSRKALVTKAWRLVTGLEDTLAYELKGEVEGNTGGLELVSAMLATRTVDIPYFLTRADRLGMGVTARNLLNKLITTFTGPPVDVGARTLLAARDRFSKILRVYSSSGYLKLLDGPGRGRRGVGLVDSLSDVGLILAAGKQLGVQG